MTTLIKVKSYSLLEPDACPVSDGNGEMGTMVYAEFMQMKQDCIILVFRCQIIKTIISQYCGHWSSAGVSRSFRLREPKAMEAWECCMAKYDWRVELAGKIILAKKGQ